MKTTTTSAKETKQQQNRSYKTKIATNQPANQAHIHTHTHTHTESKVFRVPGIVDRKTCFPLFTANSQVENEEEFTHCIPQEENEDSYFFALVISGKRNARGHVASASIVLNAPLCENGN